MTSIRQHDALGYRLDFQALVRPGRSVLSVASFDAGKKDLLSTRHAADDRLPPDAHFERLPASLAPPLLVAGVRNLQSNLRCLGYSRPMCERFGRPATMTMSVREENPRPGRPYHAIQFAGGRYEMVEYLPSQPLNRPQPELADVDWLVSGTPVEWDGEDDARLFDRIITDAADHSHVWRLPRGNHPLATDRSRAEWARLQEEFVATLPLDRDAAAARIRRLAAEFQLQREANYLHSVWGVTESGQLAIVIANGRLEDVGRRARRLGCQRAICVENSGSAALYRIDAPDQRPWLPLVRAPNFRAAGTAFVFVELANDRYHVFDPPSG